MAAERSYRQIMESLQDTGGAYFDADEGGISGVAKRWTGQVRNEVLSGDAARVAVGFVAGTALLAGGKRLSRELE